MKAPRTLYQFRGLPSYYHGLTYSDTKLSESKWSSIQASISRAPTQGVLYVAGCAGPIINQLMDMDRKVIGVSFVEYYENRFKDDEASPLPQSPVVLIYAIGSEPAKNAEYASRLLQSIIANYKSQDTLLILESDLSASNFMTKYGLTIKNSVAMPLKEEDAWI